MEMVPGAPLFTPENWQDLVLETAEYERPASPETLAELSRKLVFEAVELILPESDEPSSRLGRIAVLLPIESAEYFPNEPFMELHDSSDLRKRVAGEFGDLLWYEAALLQEKSIIMREVLDRCIDRMSGAGIDTSGVTDITSFSKAASVAEPTSYPSEHSIDENPFVVYAGWYVSMFCRSVSPEYAPEGITRDEIIDRGADLLWATTYLLENYCDADLQTTLQGNYRKLKAKEQAGIPQGENIGDPRWSTKK